MANTNKQFRLFNDAIRLTDDKRKILIAVRDSLRQRIKSGFVVFIPLDQSNGHTLDFQSQGSFIMDTIIWPLNDDFDLDDGVYFQGTLPDVNRPAPQTFHDWIILAIDKNNGIEEIIDKPTCVRVKYKQGFHIDIPIYYADNYECPDLADSRKDGN